MWLGILAVFPGGVFVTISFLPSGPTSAAGSGVGNVGVVAAVALSFGVGGVGGELAAVPGGGTVSISVIGVVVALLRKLTTCYAAEPLWGRHLSPCKARRCGLLIPACRRLTVPGPAAAAFLLLYRSPIFRCEAGIKFFVRV